MKLGHSAHAAIVAALLLVSGFGSSASATMVRMNSETIVRYFEQEWPTGETKRGIPAYEYVQLDVGQLDQDGVTGHAYGWGRYDFGDFYEDETQGEILYGYLQYRLSAYNFSARLGRQSVFEGVSGTSFDGLQIGSDLTPYFTWSGYAGQPVTLEIVNGRSGDRVWGGMLSHHAGGYYNVGVSYKRVDNDGEKEEELIGIDSSLTALGPLSFFGKSVRNQVTKSWQQHAYEARLTLGGLLLKPIYQRVDYNAFFDRKVDTSTPFSDPLGGLPALGDSNEVVTIVGGEASWQTDSMLSLGAKYKDYDYDVREQKARYYAVLATLRWSGLSQVGAEAGRMDGDVDKDRYTLGRVYAYYEFAPIFLTADGVYAKYGEKIFGDLGDDRSIFAALGGGARFFGDSLQVKVSGEYSKDPYTAEDVRGLFALEWRFSK